MVRLHLQLEVRGCGDGLDVGVGCVGQVRLAGSVLDHLEPAVGLADFLHFR